MVSETKQDLRQVVLSNLQKGKHSAVSGKLLAKRLGERDTRQLRLAIIELIEQGYPICGTAKPPHGYYIAETPEECQECLDQLMSYLKMIAQHHKYLLRASRVLLDPYQIKLKL